MDKIFCAVKLKKFLVRELYNTAPSRAVRRVSPIAGVSIIWVRNLDIFIGGKIN